MTALAALAGASAVAGLLLVVLGLYGTPPPPAGAPPARLGLRVRALIGPGGAAGGGTRRRQAELLAALGAGLLVWLVTRWPVAGLGALAAGLGLPRLLGDQEAGRGGGKISRLEALEQWTRRLSDVLVVGSGIEQALVASAKTAPAPIAAEVGALTARLRARRSTEAALRAFSDDIDDPAGDLVAAALILAARRRGRGLAEVLEGLAGAVAEEVGMRRAVEADRAKPRTTARAVSVLTVAVVVALGAFARTYAAPFGTGQGQLMLAFVFLLFGAAIWWMQTLTVSRAGTRFLPAEAVGPAGAPEPPAFRAQEPASQGAQW